MVTLLDKELRRQVTVDGQDYTVVIDPDRLRLVGKGKRKPEVELPWRDLLNGEAALAVALNASLLGKASTAAPASKRSHSQPIKPAPQKEPRKAPRKPPRKT